MTSPRSDKSRVRSSSKVRGRRSPLAHVSRPLHPVAAALYVRSLSPEQAQADLRVLQREAERRGWGVAGVYVDSGSDQTAAAEALLAAVKAKKCDAVMVRWFEAFVTTRAEYLLRLMLFAEGGLHVVELRSGADLGTRRGRIEALCVLYGTERDRLAMPPEEPRRSETTARVVPTDSAECATALAAPDPARGRTQVGRVHWPRHGRTGRISTRKTDGRRP